MVVTENDPSGWSKGKNINGGPEAYFPQSYVEVVARPEMLVEVIHDFDPLNDQENLPDILTFLNLKVGEKILVTGTHMSGWWRGCLVKGGPEGYFPGDYASRVLASPMTDPLDSMRKVWGKPNKDGYLNLKIGILKRFSKRYCYLTAKELLYFNSEGHDPKKPAGTFALDRRCTVDIVDEKKGKFKIKAKRQALDCKGDPNYFNQWVDALRAVIEASSDL
eukprot:TRINITY_DN5100_c0_g1_i1.p1 TRINITY_DN5100_c0_g1~~TRINITY_DN5100_c0_g1_i1.p1  ORF type:complete len:248 (-),score=49.01 TRINITY_DN5100_c0_g1_i1:20-679(-)